MQSGQMWPNDRSSKADIWMVLTAESQTEQGYTCRRSTCLFLAVWYSVPSLQIASKIRMYDTLRGTLYIGQGPLLFVVKRARLPFCAKLGFGYTLGVLGEELLQGGSQRQ